MSDQLIHYLRDLNHDLGKYLTLALRFLPSDAGDADLNTAVSDSLLRTRNHQDRHESAESIWKRYRSLIGPILTCQDSCCSTWSQLEDAMAAVLQWEERLPVTGDDRGEIERDFFQIPTLINRLIEEVL